MDVPLHNVGETLGGSVPSGIRRSAFCVKRRDERTRDARTSTKRSGENDDLTHSCVACLVFVTVEFAQRRQLFTWNCFALSARPSHVFVSLCPESHSSLVSLPIFLSLRFVSVACLLLSLCLPPQNAQRQNSHIVVISCAPPAEPSEPCRRENRTT